MILRGRKLTHSGLSSDQPLLAFTDTEDSQLVQLLNPEQEANNTFRTPTSKHDLFQLLGLDKAQANNPTKPTQQLPEKWRHHLTVCRRSLTRALTLNAKKHNNISRILRATKPPELSFKQMGVNPDAVDSVLQSFWSAAVQQYEDKRRTVITNSLTDQIHAHLQDFVNAIHRSQVPSLLAQWSIFIALSFHRRDYSRKSKPSSRPHKTKPRPAPTSTRQIPAAPPARAPPRRMSPVRPAQPSTSTPTHNNPPTSAHQQQQSRTTVWAPKANANSRRRSPTGRSVCNNPNTHQGAHYRETDVSCVRGTAAPRIQQHPGSIPSQPGPRSGPIPIKINRIPISQRPRITNDNNNNS